MALLNLGDDPWLVEYESCEKLQREIMEQLVAREKENRKSDTYAQLSANIRLRLKQYNNEVSQLRDKLKQITKIRAITFDEVQRRTKNIDLLVSRSHHMEKLFNDFPAGSSQARASLLDTAEWGLKDDRLLGADQPLTADQIAADKKRMLQDQEEGLDSLSKIIARQKNIAETISGEVDLQNDIIDDLGDHIERTDGRINNETRTIGIIDRKDKTCIYWVVIILLFLSIIIVVSI